MPSGCKLLLGAREEVTMHRWFTAKELAGLPGLPGTERGINKSSNFERRPRQKGKGWEYALHGLPPAAQVALLRRSGIAPATPEHHDLTPNPRRQRATHSLETLDARWARLRHGQRDIAVEKAEAIRAALTAHERHGVALITALEHAARGTRWSAATLRDAYYGKGSRAGLIDYHSAHWALVLAPGHVGRTATAACHPTAWEAFKRDYLRAEQPPLAMCHRALQRLGSAHGWEIPGPKALARRLITEVPKPLRTLLRYGSEALAKLIPPQIRDREALHAMQAVNADGHKFDVFVRWPDGTIERPMMVAWQDMRSAKILGWRVDKTENSDGYRLSFHDLLRAHGVPGEVYVDNGRGIASKMLTGGTPTRYRGKVRADDPYGLLCAVVGRDNIHWTTPYHGQSKPIERAFRDMASDIAKDWRLRGAYTGNNPMAKPENYASHAVPLDEFLEVAAEGIAQHNARRGRRGMGMHGESFDVVFDASYAANAHLIPRATEAQLARWLLAGAALTADQNSGAVRLHGNRYWTDTLAEQLSGRSAAERRVVVRYDPDHLDSPVAVETLDGRFLCMAEIQGHVAHDSTEAARDTARAQGQLKKLAKKEQEIHLRMSERELDKLYRDRTEAPTGEAAKSVGERKLVRGVFGSANRPVRPVDRDEIENAYESRFEQAVAAAARQRKPVLRMD